MSLSRRQLLVAGLAAACTRRAPPRIGHSTEPVRLGWRWVAGQELTYRVRIERTVDGRVERLAQRWTYLVRAVDPDGIATLEGRLIGVGGTIEGVDPTASRGAIDRALEPQRAGRTALLRLGTDGRLHPLPAAGCDRLGIPQPACFDAQIVHRLLALKLPQRPLSVHESWSDPAHLAPFDALLPPGVDREHTATSRVLEIDLDPLGPPSVVLGTVALVRPSQGRRSSGPVLRIEGVAHWDPERGRLRERTALATLAGSSGPDAPGRLSLHLDLVR